MSSAGGGGGGGHAEFDRSNPLFERWRVPCEFVRCASGGGGDGGGGGGGHRHYHPHHNNNVAHYTVRVLSGRRPVPGGPGGGGSERVVRFEVSDECSHFRHRRRRAAPPWPGPSSSSSSSWGASAVSGVNEDSHGGGGGGCGVPFASPQTNSGFGEQRGEGAAQPPDGWVGGPQHRGTMQGGHQMGRPPVVLMQAQRPPPMQGQAHPPIQQHRGKEEDAAHRGTSSVLLDDPIPSTPIQLYELEVGETDFADLRRDQALLVDFADFASSFIGLLGFCDLGEEEEEEDRDLEPSARKQRRGGSGDARGMLRDCHSNPMASPPPPHTPYSAQMPRYTCRLEDFASTTSGSQAGWGAGSGGHGRQQQQQQQQSRGGGSAPPQARFSVVESNQFRELTHLSLHLSRGTDPSVREYLSARLRQSMAETSALKCRLSSQICRAEAAEASSREETSRRAESEARAEAEKREIRLEAAEELRAEVGRLEAERRAAASESEEEMKRRREESERKERDMRDRADGLGGRVEALAAEKASAEADNGKLRNALELRDETVASLREEAGTLRSRLATAVEEKDRAERSLHQTQLRVAALEQSNESQERALAQADALREAAASGEARATESAEVRKGQVGTLQDKLAASESELERHRDALERYRKDRQETKKKMKGKIELIREQEEALAEKDAESYEYQRRLDEAAREVERYKADLERKDGELKEAQSKLGESVQLLESNKQVITWLNKEINETQLGRFGTRPAVPSYVGAAGMSGSTSSSARQFGNAAMAPPLSFQPSARGGSSLPETGAMTSSSIAVGGFSAEVSKPMMSRFGPSSYVTPSPDWRGGCSASGGNVIGAPAPLEPAGVRSGSDGGRATSYKGNALEAPGQGGWPPPSPAPLARPNSDPPPLQAPAPPVPIPQQKKSDVMGGAVAPRPSKESRKTAVRGAG